MTKENGNDKRVHLAHCYQGEYKDSCKYGDPDCPASDFANGPVDAASPIAVPQSCEDTLEETKEFIRFKHRILRSN